MAPRLAEPLDLQFRDSGVAQVFEHARLFGRKVRIVGQSLLDKEKVGVLDILIFLSVKMLLVGHRQKPVFFKGQILP
ncbi:MAG: hypothetical protein JNK89_02475 [Saprospiraceae bacterium]|nr:hypothetical protein [Saprospiraceae bacterium]